MRGRLAVEAEVETVGTRGVPKCRSQMWLTATRAVSGFSRSAIQRARASRRPVLVGRVDRGRAGRRQRRPRHAPGRHVRSAACRVWSRRSRVALAACSSLRRRPFAAFSASASEPRPSEQGLLGVVAIGHALGLGGDAGRATRRPAGRVGIPCQVGRDLASTETRSAPRRLERLLGQRATSRALSAAPGLGAAGPSRPRPSSSSRPRRPPRPGPASLPGRTCWRPG